MVLGARWQADRLADLLRQALPDFRPLEVHQSWAGWKIWGSSKDEIESDSYCPHWLYFHPMKGSGLEEDK